MAKGSVKEGWMGVIVMKNAMHLSGRAGHLVVVLAHMRISDGM